MNMKKLTAILMCLALAAAGVAAADEETAPTFVGEIDDGFYYLRVNLDPEDPGEWRVDDLAQDPSVVTLDGVEETETMLTARYAPAGDGEVTISLRHFTGVSCDEAHTIDLLVRDGKIVEVTGGSHTASPSDEEIDPYVSGAWTEAETQFTAMDIAKNPEGGWDVKITSPMTHGAYVFTATIYYDCELNTFVYENGAVCDLLPAEGEEPAVSEPTETGLYGTISFAGETEEDLHLVWYDSRNPETTVTFARAAV